MTDWALPFERRTIVDARDQLVLVERLVM